MKMSRDNFFSPDSNSSNFSDYFFPNDTDVGSYTVIFLEGYKISILMSFLINSYVIWLIVRGSGNGLVAEFFVFNLSVCEIILCVVISVVYLTFYEVPWIIVSFINGLSLIGYHLFECLISAERYLAVVHPVTFLKFKHLRYKLMCSAGVWITTFVFGGCNVMILSLDTEMYFIMLITTFFIFLFFKLFCLLAVLRALKQSGPGERGREREEENNMKRRAFHLILITTLSMLFLHSPYIILIAFIALVDEVFFTYVSQVCFISAGLVQPVLFFYRVGKFNVIKCQSF